MDKQKKQETIFVVVAIIFVSIMAGLKLNLGFLKTVLVAVLFIALYVVVNYIINKLFAPLYAKRETNKKKTKTLVGKPKNKK